MKKIEEAAREHCGDMEGDYTHRAIFKDGARWFADRLTSDKAVRVASESQAIDDEGAFPALGDLIGFSGENETRTIVLAALAAVRKEIEGE